MFVFVCINCNKSWCLNDNNIDFYRSIYKYKIKCEMMTDKDTKCLIRKGTPIQDIMPQSLLLATKTILGILVSVS